MKMIVKNLEDWEKVAGDFLEKFPQGGVFALSGDLGVGKTTFIRAVIGKLAARDQKEAPRVLSPSFTIHQGYDFPSSGVDHFDFYRLEGLTPAGLTEIGFWEALERAQSQKKTHFLFIEWPEKFLGELPLTAKAVLQFVDRARVFEVMSS